MIFFHCQGECVFAFLPISLGARGSAASVSVARPVCFWICVCVFVCCLRCVFCVFACLCLCVLRVLLVLRVLGPSVQNGPQMALQTQTDPWDGRSN